MTGSPRNANTGIASRMAASARDLAALQRDFPQFGFSSEVIRDQVRYVTRSMHPGIGPHTAITADLGELRATLADAATRAASRQRREAGTP